MDDNNDAELELINSKHSTGLRNAKLIPFVTRVRYRPIIMKTFVYYRVTAAYVNSNNTNLKENYLYIKIAAVRVGNRHEQLALHHS